MAGQGVGELRVPERQLIAVQGEVVIRVLLDEEVRRADRGWRYGCNP